MTRRRTAEGAAQARRGRAIGRFVTLPMGDMHLREDGPTDAPVILLVHGYASSMHAYDRLAPLLARRHRVLRVDLLGHGCSVLDAADYGAEAQARMLVAVMSRLDVRPDVVVGHSFGADVAIAVAEQATDGPRIVVVGQAPDYADARLPVGNQVLRSLRAARFVRRVAPAVLVDRASRFAFRADHDAGDLFDLPNRRSADFRATAPAVHRLMVHDRPLALAARGLDARLADLGRPALVILGAQDQLYPVGPTQARYARLRSVRVEVLGDSGHSPPLEQPEATARLIEAFAAEP